MDFKTIKIAVTILLAMPTSLWAADYPMWCECLGISCLRDTLATNTPASRETERRIRMLSSHLNEFLPQDTYRAVANCSSYISERNLFQDEINGMRGMLLGNHDEAIRNIIEQEISSIQEEIDGLNRKLARIREDGRRVLGGLRGLVLIPSDRLSRAGLANNEYRFVQSCSPVGHFLQMSDQSGSDAQLLQRLRSALASSLYVDVNRVVSGLGSARGNISSVSTDYFTMGGDRTLVRRQATYTPDNNGGFNMSYGTTLPPEYASQDCINYLRRHVTAVPCPQGAEVVASSNQGAAVVQQADPNAPNAPNAMSLSDYQEQLRRALVLNRSGRNCAASDPGCDNNQTRSRRENMARLFPNVNRQQLATLERQALQESSSDSERHLHATRLILLDRATRGLSDSDRSDALTRLADQTSWCRENACECRSSGLLSDLSYAEGFFRGVPNDPQHVAAFGRRKGADGFASRVSNEGCGASGTESDPFVSGQGYLLGFGSH